VGTYRVLGPQAARRAGGLYSDAEFDLSPLASLKPQAVELGRSCVHPAWRSGGVIMALWSALCQYMLAHRLDTMIGCASIGLDDGGQMAGRLWRHLRETHLVAPQWQVSPRTPLPLDDAVDLPPAVPGVKGMADAPPLIKGYLRCGARLLGPPALDAAFNTADLPMMLRIDELAPRYRKHFFGS
jgi:putative hemolysin